MWSCHPKITHNKFSVVSPKYWTPCQTQRQVLLVPLLHPLKVCWRERFSSFFLEIKTVRTLWLYISSGSSKLASHLDRYIQEKKLVLTSSVSMQEYSMSYGGVHYREFRGKVPQISRTPRFTVLAIYEQSQLSRIICWSQNTFQKKSRDIYNIFSVKVLIENKHSGEKGLHQKVDLFNMKQKFWPTSSLKWHFKGFVFMPMQNKTNLEIENC